MRSFAFAAVVLLSTTAAAQTDVIRGRVTARDSLPLEGVAVRATSYFGQVEKRTTTDRGGRFTLIFLNGEGDYWIELIKLGFAPKRFEIKRIGDEEVLIANAHLSDAVPTLDAMNVVDQRTRTLPSRNAVTPDVGGGDRVVSTNAVPVDRAGNLAAMAATVAGIQLIPGLDGATDMFSMLGLTGNQNNTTFDGLGSGITALPPDILATTSIRPYPFDPSIGGFSGAQVSVQTLPGSNFSRRSIASFGIAPALEWAHATAAAQGHKYTNARVGGNAAGPISMNRAFYNMAYNAGRRFSDLRTVLNTAPIGLAAAGIAPDSAERFANILAGQRIPTTSANVPRLQAQDVAQAAANFDVMPSASGSGHSFTLGAVGSYQRTQPVSRGGLLFTTPAHGGEALAWGANGALTHANYFWSAVLSKTTLGVAASNRSSTPFESLPEGIVRVASTLGDGSTAVKPLLFGGNSIASSVRSNTVQLNNQLTWYSLDNKHSLKLASSITADAFTNDLSQNELGTFTYNSLADLEAGRPSMFARTFGARRETSSQVAGSVSLGDYWRPSPALQVVYGLRADANRFLSAPARNETLLNILGAENARTPDAVYLSPRVGLQWYYGKARQVAYAPGAARPPRAVIHAGIGVFQNMAASSLVGPALAATGLSTSTQSLVCVGDATPIPDWSAFAAGANAIPTRCADGTAGAFATTAPSVTLFDRSFRQPRSVRAAGDWSGPIFDNRFVLGVQGVASWGLAQQGAIDLNLRASPSFTLATESNRPVFVDPSSIVPTTGAVTSAGSRVAPQFQHVWSQRSGLRVDSRQVSINLKPITANPRLRWDATYTRLHVRETFNGFSSTAGDPRVVQSGIDLESPAHLFSLVWSDFPLFDLVYVSADVRIAPGMRYTPMVAGDVNGDGLVNDRAFIPSPATADPATAAALHALGRDATPAVRRCLERQFNSLAQHGSCRAPSIVAATMLLKFNPQKIGLPKRTTLSLQVLNPLAIADLAMHGSENVRGWGQTFVPDQNLLFVRGFDPQTKTFKYDVNQRFGATRPQQSTTSNLPFISLGLKVDIGVPRERQLLTQRLNAGRRTGGTKASADAMTVFGVSSIPNPMYLILQQSDSLGLTRVQADSLATLSRAFAVFADSIWAPIGRFLEALPSDYSSRVAYDRYVSAREQTIDYLMTLVPTARGVLTSAQRRRLPPQVANFLDERVLKFLRSSSAGDNSSVIAR